MSLLRGLVFLFLITVQCVVQTQAQCDGLEEVLLFQCMNPFFNDNLMTFSQIAGTESCNISEEIDCQSGEEMVHCFNNQTLSDGCIPRVENLFNEVLGSQDIACNLSMFQMFCLDLPELRTVVTTSGTTIYSTSSSGSEDTTTTTTPVGLGGDNNTTVITTTDDMMTDTITAEQSTADGTSIESVTSEITGMETGSQTETSLLNSTVEDDGATTPTVTTSDTTIQEATSISGAVSTTNNGFGRSGTNQEQGGGGRGGGGGGGNGGGGGVHSSLSLLATCYLVSRGPF